METSGTPLEENTGAILSQIAQLDQAGDYKRLKELGHELAANTNPEIQKKLSEINEKMRPDPVHVLALVLTTLLFVVVTIAYIPRPAAVRATPDGGGMGPDPTEIAGYGLPPLPTLFAVLLMCMVVWLFARHRALTPKAHQSQQKH